MSKMKFFDFEVYPNWWCCTVSDQEDTYPGGVYDYQFDENTEHSIKDRMRVYTSDEEPETVRNRLKKDLSKGVLCGYNIKGYDLIIAKCIFAGFTPRKLHIASELIIHPEYANKTPEHMRIFTFIKWGWSEAEAWQDLMDDNVKSLKDKECALGMDIREATVSFDKEVLTEEDKKDIIFYNKHDVYALHVYYWVVSKPYVDTKIQICDIFGLSRRVGYTNTNAVLSGKVLEGVRTHGTTIKDPTITIRNPKLKEYFEKHIPYNVYNHLLTNQTSKIFDIFDNEISIGDGGLHSVFTLPRVGRKLPALYVESTDEWGIYLVDASSCYSSVMIYCNAMSRAIRNPARLVEMYNRRMKLKATPKNQWTQDDFYFVAAAKIVLNTVYGAMGNKWLVLYDDYMRSKVCRIGQMILISLSNCFYKNIPNVKVIQTNTDGILIYAKRKYYEQLQSLVDEFSQISSFLFETEEYSNVWQLNVNNYIAISNDGDVKNKGGSFVKDIFDRGSNKVRPLNNHCVSTTQIDYYTSFNKDIQVDPIKHLLDNTNVNQLCITCTKGGTYYGMYHLLKDGEYPLGKVTRVLAVKDDNLKSVVKRKWALVKPTITQIRAGKTVQSLVEYYTVQNRKIKQECDKWYVHQEDTCALCPPNALVVNDALYNYKIENGKLKHVDGRVWEIDYDYYIKELDKVLSVNWYKMKNEELEITKEFDYKEAECLRS